jgi:hypothetical protein
MNDRRQQQVKTSLLNNSNDSENFTRQEDEITAYELKERSSLLRFILAALTGMLLSVSIVV